MPGHSKQLRRSAPSSDLLCDDDEPEFFTADLFQGPRGRTKRKQKEQVELPDGPVSFGG